MASNCHSNSKRESYINELKKHVPIDVYGKCGGHGKIEENNIWEPTVIKQYKFYLSFESSLCDGYVTEKLGKILYGDSKIIPIVRGYIDYNLVAPPHSYINVADFASPEDLAEYLYYLNNNETAFNKYFEWKKYYTTIRNYRDYSFCLLCEKLNNVNEPKSIFDVDEKFHKTCHKSDSIIGVSKTQK